MQISAIDHTHLGTWEPDIPPTYQQVKQTCDTIIADTTNPIFEKLYFRVINSSQLTRNRNDRLLGFPEEAFDYCLVPKSGDYIIPGCNLQVVIM